MTAINKQNNGASKQHNTIWICYRCNLTFHEESIAALHDTITNHPARKIETLQTKGGASIAS